METKKELSKKARPGEMTIRGSLEPNVIIVPPEEVEAILDRAVDEGIMDQEARDSIRVIREWPET